MNFRQVYASFQKSGLALSVGLLLLGATPIVEMVKVPAGTFSPQFSPRPGQKEFQIASFWLDTRPVTQGEFLKFVQKHPQWRRSQVPLIFQEGHYLSAWRGDLMLPTASTETKYPSEQAVTGVSWMAARAFCAEQGKRLPNLLEWEYAAEETDPEKLLWYSQVGIGVPQAVGLTQPNQKGLRDLHRMYEWVEDFNQVIMTNDSREGSERDNKLFCGNAGSATDRMNYAAFTRYAFWSSLHPAYTMKNLGFRCARNP
jgi:formylglycine-generating enzyme